MKNKIIQINIKTINSKTLSLYIEFFKKTLTILNVDFTLFKLPVKKKRKTLLKAPHVNKTAREQFELREHKCIITLTINESLKNHQKFLNFLFQ